VKINSANKNIVDKFDGKVIELLAKIATGSAVHTYGSGLGIFDFSCKLNQYRNYNLEGWEGGFKAGCMMYL